MTDLGTRGGSFSEANAINERGPVMAIAVPPRRRTTPSSWQDGVMTDLGALGGIFSHFSAALDMNERGEVVGYGGTAQEERFEQHAVLWVTELSSCFPFSTADRTHRRRIADYSMRAGKLRSASQAAIRKATRGCLH